MLKFTKFLKYPKFAKFLKYPKFPKFSKHPKFPKFPKFSKYPKFSKFQKWKKSKGITDGWIHWHMELLLHVTKNVFKLCKYILFCVMNYDSMDFHSFHSTTVRILDKKGGCE